MRSLGYKLCKYSWRERVRFQERDGLEGPLCEQSLVGCRGYLRAGADERCWRPLRYVHWCAYSQTLCVRRMRPGSQRRSILFTTIPTIGTRRRCPQAPRSSARRASRTFLFRELFQSAVGRLTPRLRLTASLLLRVRSFYSWAPAS
jgi:hypothetical protein